MESANGPGAKERKEHDRIPTVQRNMKVSNQQTKSAAYFSLVRTIRKHYSTVLSPYIQEYISKVEMVRCRAARYVINRYRNTISVTSVLEHLERETLKSCRTKAQLTMLLKIINRLVDIPASQYLVAASTRTCAHHTMK